MASAVCRLYRVHRFHRVYPRRAFCPFCLKRISLREWASSQSFLLGTDCSCCSLYLPVFCRDKICSLHLELIHLNNKLCRFTFFSTLLKPVDLCNLILQDSKPLLHKCSRKGLQRFVSFPMRFFYSHNYVISQDSALAVQQRQFKSCIFISWRCCSIFFE